MVCWEGVFRGVHILSILLCCSVRHKLFFSEICPFLRWQFWLKTSCDCKGIFIPNNVLICHTSMTHTVEIHQQSMCNESRSNKSIMHILLKMGDARNYSILSTSRRFSSIHHFEKYPCACMHMHIIQCNIVYPKISGNHNTPHHTLLENIFERCFTVSLLLKRSIDLSP